MSIDMDRAQALAENVELRHVLILCRAGVPYDVAMALDPMDRLGYVVAIGEVSSDRRFDWVNLRWIDPS